jgi:hypothetical protein
VERLKLERDSEVEKARKAAEEKVTKQLIVANPATHVGGPAVKMEVYILAAVVAILAIYLMQNGNARRSETEDTLKMLIPLLTRNQNTPAHVIDQRHITYPQLPAPPTVVPALPASSEPYFVSWGSLWWIFCIGSAIYLVIALCCQCFAAVENATLRVFKNQAYEEVMAKHRYVKSADDDTRDDNYTRYDDDVYHD